MTTSHLNPADALLNEQQASARLNVSVRTLQAWRLKGGGPHFCKLGRSVRYRQPDLDTWLNGNVRAHTSESAA